MKLLIESFITTLLVVVSVIILSSLINAQVQVNDAKDYHAACISQIEASNFDPTVITKLQQDAASQTGRGYVLGVTGSSTETDKLICGNCNHTNPATATKCEACGSSNIYHYAKDRLYTVNLTYKVKVKVLNIERTGVINGYAR